MRKNYTHTQHSLTTGTRRLNSDAYVQRRQQESTIVTGCEKVKLSKQLRRAAHAAAVARVRECGDAIELMKPYERWYEPFPPPPAKWDVFVHNVLYGRDVVLYARALGQYPTNPLIQDGTVSGRLSSKIANFAMVYGQPLGLDSKFKQVLFREQQERDLNKRAARVTGVQTVQDEVIVNVDYAVVESYTMGITLSLSTTPEEPKPWMVKSFLPWDVFCDHPAFFRAKQKFTDPGTWDHHVHREGGMFYLAGALDHLALKVSLSRHDLKLYTDPTECGGQTLWCEPWVQAVVWRELRDDDVKRSFSHFAPIRSDGIGPRHLAFKTTAHIDWSRIRACLDALLDISDDEKKLMLADILLRDHRTGSIAGIKEWMRKQHDGYREEDAPSPYTLRTDSVFNI